MRRNARLPFGPAGRNQRPLGADRLIEPVEDRRPVNQHLTAGQHERRNAADRIYLPHGVEVGEHRARVVFVVEADDRRDTATQRA